jgi:hypothetical protein
MKVASLALLTTVGVLSQATPPPTPALPLNPIAAILEAFKTHDIVALGEPHGNEQAAAFRVALVQDPRFADVVDDIVVEAVNSRYQDTVDRFVSGQNVTDATLRQAWQNTTIANFLWERPIYEHFVRAVRDVNLSRAKQKRLRLLLGDPPIDWNAVRTADDLVTWLLERDASAVNVIREQVLAKRHRALVIYGEGHFWRHHAGNNLVTRLERDGTSVFTLSTPIQTDLANVQPDVTTWPKPSVARLRGTVIGAKEFVYFFPNPRITTDSPRYEDQIDAVLYLGSPTTMTTSMLPAALCADERYLSMRVARMQLDPGPPGSPPPRDRLRRNCATK